MTIQVSPEEIKRAEESMTDAQKSLSHWRVQEECEWDPKRRRKEEPNNTEDFLGNPESAKKRGEQTIEIQLDKIEFPATKLEAVAWALIVAPNDARSNSTYPIRNRLHEAIDAQLKTEFVLRMNEKYPEIVEASKIYQQNKWLLSEMIDSDGRGNFSKSDTYNIDIARRAFQENRVIAEKFGFSDFFEERASSLGALFQKTSGEELFPTPIAPKNPLGWLW